MTLIRKLKQTKLVAIMRKIEPAQVVPVTRALMSGGIEFVELTMDSEKAAAGISLLLEHFPSLQIGAGTVTNEQLATEALAAGAKYLVSPNVNTKVIDAGVAADIPVWPGALTPTEVVQAWETGAQAVKIFPAGVWGTQYLKAIRGPLEHIPMIATGGIGAADAASYIQAGATAVGMGGKLFDVAAIQEKNYEIITEESKRTLSLLQS